MQPGELQSTIKRLDSGKLTDIVKNYRQYGYSLEIRDYALRLLEERGISHEDLLLTGNLENKTYDSINELWVSFKRNSKLAFLFYGIMIPLKGIAIWFAPITSFGTMVLSISLITAAILYFIFLIRSFLNQSDFYKATGDEFGSDGALVYLLLGMPFYVVMYFVFQSQMNERMKMVQ